jgi:hypothetical protein
MSPAQVGQTSIFVWTEVFNCGALAEVLVPSYLAHNHAPIHVYGFPDDLKGLIQDNQVVPVPIDRLTKRRRTTRPLSSAIDGPFLSEGFDRGHLGTARLWAHLLSNRREELLVHVDADLVFIGNAVDDVIEALMAGNVLAGARRMYRNNLNERDDIRSFPDCVDTLCFGLRRDALPPSTYPGMVRRIRQQTYLDRLRRRLPIDFFDSVTFDLMKRGSVAYLDSPDDGVSGTRRPESSFLSKIIEVRSAVGSGCAFSKGLGMNVTASYREYALESFSVYAYYLLGQETGIPRPVPGALEERLQRINQEKWCLDVP